MKKIFAALALMFVFNFSNAQTADEQKAPWIDGDQNAFTIDIPSTVDNVEGALKQRLASEGGLKVSTKKGFITCLAANWSKISSSTMDYYFKVKKSSGGHVIVYIFASKGYNNFITSAANPDEAGHAKDFLYSMINETKRYELNLALVDMSKKIKSANDDMDDLVKQQRKLEDKIKDLNKSLDENHNNQNKKSKEIDNLKNQLADLQSKLDGLR